VESLKLAYADRDTYYGDPDSVKVPAAELLSAEYAAQRAAEVGERASLAFRPGKIAGFKGVHPSVDSAAAPLNLTRDTTCLVAMDAAGNMFAATPSGAWLPSVIAGDTGIPLTQRAQSFLLVEGHPNELAGGKRPRVTLSPTLVTLDGAPAMVLATPGGDNQEQVQLQVLLNLVSYGMTAQRAVEAARFQTRHLVSSFDNHGMAPGQLDMDERIAAETVKDLLARGHKVEVRSRWASEAAPVVIRVLAGGVLEAGADPYAYRAARAW
jgi:gamma-glutamyltranspeptidase/glutathione hydrolase